MIIHLHTEYFHILDGKTWVYPNENLKFRYSMLVKDKYEVVYYYRVNEIASIFGIFYDKDKMLHKISTYVLHLFFYKISEYRNNKIKEILYDE